MEFTVGVLILIALPIAVIYTVLFITNSGEECNPKESSRDLNEIRELQNRAIKTLPARGSIWRHYKGDRYIVSGSSYGEADGVIMIHYYAEDREKRLPIHWRRDVFEWNQLILTDNGLMHRFKYEGERKSKLSHDC